MQPEYNFTQRSLNYTTNKKTSGKNIAHQATKVQNSNKTGPLQKDSLQQTTLLWYHGFILHITLAADLQ
jgi:hypothetical protein